MTVSFQTTMEIGAASENQLANDQKATAKPIGSWERSLEKIKFMPKDTDVSKEVKENLKYALEKI